MQRLWRRVEGNGGMLAMRILRRHLVLVEVLPPALPRRARGTVGESLVGALGSIGPLEGAHRNVVGIIRTIRIRLRALPTRSHAAHTRRFMLHRAQPAALLIQAAPGRLQVPRLLLDLHPVHDRPDPRYTVGDAHRVIRLLLRPHRPGELDDARADRPDVDAAVAEHAVAEERLEHPILQSGELALLRSHAAQTRRAEPSRARTGPVPEFSTDA